VAVDEKVGAKIVAKARNAMAAQREQGSSGDLGGGVEGTFMAAPLIGISFVTSNAVPFLHPIPVFATMRNRKALSVCRPYIPRARLPRGLGFPPARADKVLKLRKQASAQ
jgi:hypothetical protein